MEENISRKIDSLREKPQHVKEAILLVSVAVAAAILLTFWVSTFSVTTTAPVETSSNGGIVASIKNLFGFGPASVTPVDPAKSGVKAPEAGPVGQ